MIREKILTSRLDKNNITKLRELSNSALYDLIADAILKFQPTSVFVSDGSSEDLHRIRRQALRLGEEQPLNVAGHTVHFDGFLDQGRDPGNTKILINRGMSLGPQINAMERKDGLCEIGMIMDGIMRGKEMIVSFYSLGPLGTGFAIPCVQITDSYYVVHSEDILYRQGYTLFKDMSKDHGFFAFLHSAGTLRNGVSRDTDHRRIYIDLVNNFVYSANTQYAGNTVAAKKLAHRLAIKKAADEGWLAEHLFIGSVPSYENGQKIYIAGAFPSWCGKTSTSMLFNIVGDDLAHLRKKEGVVYAANVERGMFGVIKDVNEKDDPYIHNILLQPGEIIFSNVLDAGGDPYWQGMGQVEIPLKGRNHSGEWWRGKKNEKSKPIPISHDNARFCVALQEISTFEPAEVVPLHGIVYGGRNSRRPVPVMESYGWVHGVFYGAGIESEPTAATVETAHSDVIINPMANEEFLSIPIGRYLQNHIDFGADLRIAPRIFYVNYFLRDDGGHFLNTKMDKKVWIRWMERRIADKLSALATPVGYIPKYEDLAELFGNELGTRYTREQYKQQFLIRVRQLLAKLSAVEQFYARELETGYIPDEIFRMIELQKTLLLGAQEKFGNRISPFKFEGYPMPEELTQPY
jgi:phosphoenolpyruvate carboxykinase (GTP)